MNPGSPIVKLIIFVSQSSLCLTIPMAILNCQDSWISPKSILHSFKAMMWLNTRTATLLLLPSLSQCSTSGTDWLLQDMPYREKFHFDFGSMNCWNYITIIGPLVIISCHISNQIEYAKLV